MNSASSYYMLIISLNLRSSYSVLGLNPSGDITTTVKTAHNFPQA